MEKTWKRLPGSRTEPPGPERAVLRKLPMITLVGTSICMAAALMARVYWWGDRSNEALRALQMVDIWVIAAIVLHWTVILTVAIFCVIVFVMKGPAYVADRYDLPDSNTPRDSTKK